MKKYLRILMIVPLIFILQTTRMNAAPLIEHTFVFTVDSNEYTLYSHFVPEGTAVHSADAPMFICPETGSHMVILRNIVEALAGTSAITWYDEYRAVGIDAWFTNITIYIDEPLPENYGYALLINGRTFVPVEFAARLFQCAGWTYIAFYPDSLQFSLTIAYGGFAPPIICTCFFTIIDYYYYGEN